MPRQAELSATVRVLVGLVEDVVGRVLVNQRPPGKHMAGYWEFPGGKRRDGESRFAALRRELAEELAIEVVAAEPLTMLQHDYADRRVELDVWLVQKYRGVPLANEGQNLRWVEPAELGSIGLLDADRPIVDALVDRSASVRGSAQR